MFGNTCMKTCVNKCISNSKLYVLEKKNNIAIKKYNYLYKPNFEWQHEL